MRAIPTRQGSYWGMWKIADDATDPACDYTPSRTWEVMSVEDTDGGLFAYVPGVVAKQSLENFHWAAQEALAAPPVMSFAAALNDETARAAARYKAMTPAEREEFLIRKRAKA